MSVALVTLVALVATTGAPARAAERTATTAGPCTYAHLWVQPKVVLSVPDRTANATVTTDCQDFEYFTNTWDSWSGMAGGTVQGTVIFLTDHTTTARGIDALPQIFDTSRLGVWTWTPERTLPPLTLDDLNTVRMDVRVGSASYVSARRSGATVTVSTRSYRYWTSTHAFGTWGRATGVIEWRTPGTTTWHGLKNVYADNLGRYSYRYTVSAVREYRVRTFDQPYVWGFPSTVPARA
ncbi:hypothetical protein GCM10009858_12210 [Terrabacter carboxydivorans]|uniref:Uncharacterized protein n=2 Tax=Terrabacter carboxydivorans TaxID=619730 RepID=A0ABP5Y7N3_9MICO